MSGLHIWLLRRILRRAAIRHELSIVFLLTFKECSAVYNEDNVPTIKSYLREQFEVGLTDWLKP